MTNIHTLTDINEVEQELEITDYLLERLPGKKKAAFVERLKTDESLKLAVEMEKQFVEKITSSTIEYTISERGFRQFQQQIDELELPKKHQSNKIAKPKLKHSGIDKLFNPRWIGGVAATIFIALSIVLLPDDQTTIVPRTGYETLTDGNQKIINNSSRLLYSVVFDAAVGDSERSALAEKFKFSIISGPQEGQVFIIKVNKLLSNEDLEQLRSIQQIIFMEPTVMASSNEK
jgi:hypothetical protein